MIPILPLITAARAYVLGAGAAECTGLLANGLARSYALRAALGLPGADPSSDGSATMTDPQLSYLFSGEWSDLASAASWRLSVVKGFVGAHEHAVPLAMLAEITVRRWQRVLRWPTPNVRPFWMRAIEQGWFTNGQLAAIEPYVTLPVAALVTVADTCSDYSGAMTDLATVATGHEAAIIGAGPATAIGHGGSDTASSASFAKAGLATGLAAGLGVVAASKLNRLSALVSHEAAPSAPLVTNQALGGLTSPGLLPPLLQRSVASLVEKKVSTPSVAAVVTAATLLALGNRVGRSTDTKAPLASADPAVSPLAGPAADVGYPTLRDLLAVGAPLVVTSSFGDREGFRSKPHRGVDLRAGVGSPVHAPVPGWPTWVRNDAKGGLSLDYAISVADLASDPGTPHPRTGERPLGYVVTLRHLSSVSGAARRALASGDKLPQATVIALAGATGAVTGPHLHVEVRPTYGRPSVAQVKSPSTGDPIDPLLLLPTASA